MAAFSYQKHYPFLLDSACFPDTPIDLPILSPQLEDMSNASSCFPYSDVIPHIVDAKNYESSSSLSQMTHSSVVVHPHGTEGTPQVPEGSMEKRKDRNEPCLSSAQSKDSKESKSKKQKKTSSGLKGKEEKKLKTTEKKGVKPCVEPATGYIHVRARRGQATDSHSLAERVRREKISERMKMLQSLVPGCDKWVTGKALLLDEIINYVQSLQKQVEFLSMKLASMNPLLYDFALDFVGHTKQPEELEGMSQPMPSVLETNHNELAVFEDATNSLRMMETSLPVSLHGDGAIAFSQDNGSALMQVGDQRQSLLHQVVSKNMCFFQ